MKTRETKMKKNILVRALALMFAVALIIPFAGVKTVYASGANAETSENTEGENSGNGDINDLDISMQDGQIVTNFDDGGDSSSTWGTLFNKYKILILGFNGLATLTFVLLFIKNFLLIGANSDNPSARREAINGCLWTGIATALCGSVMVVVGLFWNAFK